jgi:hypothetical protein
LPAGGQGFGGVRTGWVKYYRSGQPYRESTRTADRSEAKRFLSRRLAEIATGAFAGIVVECVTVGLLAEGLITDYLAT